MAKAHFGLIRVVSFENNDIVQLHGRVIEKTFPGLTVSSRCIEDQPRGIYDDETEAQAIPKIIRLGVQFAQEGRIKGIVILGENPDLSDPDRKHVQAAFKKVEFMTVIDLFENETSQFAHVFLPAASFAEKDGTYTNTERRVQRIRKAIEPIDEAKPDWWIIKEISNRFGYTMSYESPEEIMEEIGKLTPSYAGITYDRLEGEGLLWPCPNTEHPGTKYLHKARFTRGKGLFHPIE